MQSLKLLLFTISLLFPGIYITGQDISLEDKVFDNRIHTIQFYREGWELSYPVITLNSNDRLVLQFDLLANNAEDYDYTFIHCDKDWNRSDIIQNEYLDGFPENRIEDFSHSFNTTVGYFHYSLSFPNDDVKLTLSGNYIISVFPAGKPDNPSFTQRFVIAEDAAKINVMAHRPQTGPENDSGQQIDFTVSIDGLGLIDPYMNVYSDIIQNGRWSTAKMNLKPDIYGPVELQYNSLSDRNIFPGGNEFRYFDIRSIKYLSEYLDRIDYMPPYYNIRLKPSENREFKPYFYWKDLNGRFYIATREGENPGTDADYVNVFFTLPSKYMIAGGNMYVAGAFNGWAFDSSNIMTYNPQAGQYECTILLKQGWYNYVYVYLRNGGKPGPPTLFEGNHYETENDYLILTYYRNPLERYDRVIGSALINTLNRISY